jgi:hypothetical protein
MLSVTDNKFAFELTYEESIDLELKLNVSAHGRTWKHIGDVLYEYGTKRLGTDHVIYIGTPEFNFLCRLREKKSWEQCKGFA